MKIIGIIISILIFASQAMAAQVTLAWDATNPTPQGYRIFQRAAGSAYNYGAPAWTGTATTCTIGNLMPGTTYFFVARAFVGPDQSGNSNEVTVAPVAPTPTSTPTATPEPTPVPICVPAAEGAYQVGAFDVAVTLRIADPAYQGNVKSKVFHKKGCRYFDCADCAAKFIKREEAIAAGYRPCGTCKP